MRPPYLLLLCLLCWARAIGLAATPALPPLFFPNPPGSPSLYVGQTPALRAFFDRGGVIFQGHGTQVRVRYAYANPETSIEAAEPLSARVNLFLGAKAEDWHRGMAYLSGSPL